LELQKDNARVAYPPDYILDEARLAALYDYDILDTPSEPGFDDIVELACQVCDAPVALVSLVDKDRQWFKARVGFSECQTNLSSSVCVFALIASDLLVIGDLAKDPRTSANPLVAGEPHIRFYAGAPLRTKSGQVIGSLCVIDGKPRPDGLTPAQASGLRNLSRQVMSQLDLRRSLAERDEILAVRQIAEQRYKASQRQLAESAADWRGLFERLSEGFMVGEVIRSEDGAITDCRYIELNSAWSALTGLAPERALGRTFREIQPDVETVWIEEIAKVVETGESISFIRHVEGLQRTFEGRTFPLDHDRFGVLFLEVTARVRSEARRNALLELGDRLRDLGSIPDMIRTASEFVGLTLQASRAGFARFEAGHEFVVVEADWTVADVPSIVGRHRFEDYGELRDSLLEGRSLVIDNVVTDPRTRSASQRLIDIGVRSLVNMAVREKGRPIAMLLVHDRKARSWTPEDLAFISNVADRLEAGVGRVQAENDQRLLNQELSHRIKNMMAVVQAIVKQTLKTVQERDIVRALEERIHTLSSAHDILLRQSWTSAPIGIVVGSVLDMFGITDRFNCDGPEIALGPRATLSISLLVHELSTNALKYGALSVDGGRVDLKWRLTEAIKDRELVLTWQENGGPIPGSVGQGGFGSRLIKMGLVGTGGSALRYAETGFQGEFRAPLSQIQLS
jgi:two-component sensor histidine kinase/PAS domain-containing protein